MVILDGAQLANEILDTLAKEPGVKNLSLAVVQVGENAVSKTYINEKQKACKKIGMGFELFVFPASISANDLKRTISEIGKNPAHSGIIVQLPLPPSLPSQEILDCIPQEKDVDVLSTRSFGAFALSKTLVLPPTVCAVGLLLQKAGVSLKGKTVAVVGAGRLVGLPAAIWLLRQGATVVCANKFTEDLASVTKNADVVISGVGQKNLITGAMVKKGSVVIDAGTSIESGTSSGDVQFESVSKKAGFLTKVPGGVGPLTVACLLKNLFNGYLFK